MYIKKLSLAGIIIFAILTILIMPNPSRASAVDYLVITGKEPNPMDKLAAVELSKYINKITKCTTNVIESNKLPNSPGKKCTYLIGNPTANAVISELNKKVSTSKIDLTKLGGDGFAEKSFKGKGTNFIIIGGNRPVSSLYGVYDYLERFCNTGFFMDGEYVPSLKAIPVTGIDISEKPFFRDRHFQMWFCYGLKKYWGRFKTVAEMDEYLSWMVKRKLNLANWIFNEAPEWGGMASVNTFDFECKPEEQYYAGWPGGTWDIDPAKRTKWLQDWFKFARDRGMKIAYSVNVGGVPKQYREKHPNLNYVPNLGYDANMLFPDSKEAKELFDKYMNEIIKMYGTDHIYWSTPYSESTGAADPEESFKIKLSAAKNLCDLLSGIDSEYKWYSDSWDFGAQSGVWTKNRIKRYIEALPNDRMYMADATAGDNGGFYKSTDYFGGIDWGFGMIHSFQGDDHLHGNMKDIIRRAQEAENDPNSKHLKGFYHFPESNGHNIMYYQLTTALSWDPNKVNLDNFLKKYAATRYGQKSSKTMLDCLKKVVDAVYSGGGLDMYYQRIGITYSPEVSPPYDDYQAYKGQYFELKREISLMEEAVKIALQEVDNQKGNKLFENDLVDFTKTMLGLKSNYYLIEAYTAFKQGNLNQFNDSSDKAIKCLNGIQQILSTRPDYSLAKQIKEVMAIPGTNPYLPKMIRKGCINDMYPNTEIYEQLALFYKPKVQAYLDEMRGRLSKGINTFTYSDTSQKFNEYYNKWWNEEAVCPPDIAFKGSTIDAIKAVYQTVPYGEIKSSGSIDLKENQVLNCTPDKNSELSAISWEDGQIKKVNIDGKSCWSLGEANNHYLYFAAELNAAYKCRQPVVIMLNYFDGDTGTFTLQYDSYSSPYKSVQAINLTGTNTWKVAKLVLDDARFAKSQNGASDFRIEVSSGKLMVADAAVASTRNTVLPTFDVIKGSN